MKQKTQEYVQFIKENHKGFGGGKSGAECAKEMGVSQGRVSQLIKSMREVPSESPQTMEQAAA
jgi:DNA-binding transcriptional regulator YdaS (Cro superfamily)